MRDRRDADKRDQNITKIFSLYRMTLSSTRAGVGRGPGSPNMGPVLLPLGETQFHAVEILVIGTEPGGHGHDVIPTDCQETRVQQRVQVLAQQDAVADAVSLPPRPKVRGVQNLGDPAT